MNEIRAIDLTDRERALEQAICWDVGELWEREDRFEQLDKMRELAESLFTRGAVPQIRLDYLTEPEMNMGGRGKSRLQLFERSGVFGTDLFSYPHFLPFLDYFIHGPNLPVPTIQGFRRIIETRVRTFGMLLRQVLPFVRKEIRIRGLYPRQAAEEFFKLAHEMNKPKLAEPVRSAAMNVRIGVR
jgi:hypothetical protein